MKTTDTYGFPYPECDPPLVKDASQIVQLRNLAFAVDTATEQVADEADLAIVRPQTVRVSQSVAVASTANLVTPVFNSVQFNPYALTFDANGAPIADETGWWLVGTYAIAVCATPINAQVRFTINGSAATSWSDEAAVFQANTQYPYASTMLYVSEGQTMNLEVMHDTGGSPSWTSRAFFWALKVIAA